MQSKTLRLHPAGTSPTASPQFAAEATEALLGIASAVDGSPSAKRCKALVRAGVLDALCSCVDAGVLSASEPSVKAALKLAGLLLEPSTKTSGPIVPLVIPLLRVSVALLCMDNGADTDSGARECAALFIDRVTLRGPADVLGIFDEAKVDLDECLRGLVLRRCDRLTRGGSSGCANGGSQPSTAAAEKSGNRPSSGADDTRLAAVQPLDGALHQIWAHHPSTRDRIVAAMTGPAPNVTTDEGVENIDLSLSIPGQYVAAGTTIRFTIDGSVPTEASSRWRPGTKILLDDAHPSRTIRAIAHHPGGGLIDSAVTTEAVSLHEAGTPEVTVDLAMQRIVIETDDDTTEAEYAVVDGHQATGGQAALSTSAQRYTQPVALPGAGLFTVFARGLGRGNRRGDIATQHIANVGLEATIGMEICTASRFESTMSRQSHVDRLLEQLLAADRLRGAMLRQEEQVAMVVEQLATSGGCSSTSASASAELSATLAESILKRDAARSGHHERLVQAKDSLGKLRAPVTDAEQTARAVMSECAAVVKQLAKARKRRVPESLASPEFQSSKRRRVHTTPPSTPDDKGGSSGDGGGGPADFVESWVKNVDVKLAQEPGAQFTVQQKQLEDQLGRHDQIATSRAQLATLRQATDMLRAEKFARQSLKQRYIAGLVASGLLEDDVEEINTVPVLSTLRDANADAVKKVTAARQACKQLETALTAEKPELFFPERRLPTSAAVVRVQPEMPPPLNYDVSPTTLP